MSVKFPSHNVAEALERSLKNADGQWLESDSERWLVRRRVAQGRRRARAYDYS